MPVPTRTMPTAPPTRKSWTKRVSMTPRPNPPAVATAGGFGRAVIETRFVQGFIVGGATGVVRVGTSFARSIQTGYLRAYALLLLLGVAALALYFLLASS